MPILVSIVMSIPTCHAGDRGSIPRLGGFLLGGAVTEWVRPSTGDRTFDGSSPTSVTTFLFGTLTIPFTPIASVFRMRQ